MLKKGYDNSSVINWVKNNFNYMKQNEIHYISVDSDINDLDEIGEQAYNLALNSGINVLSDKTLTYVAVFDNIVIGALFWSLFNNSYSFDVVVHPPISANGHRFKTNRYSYV